MRVCYLLKLTMIWLLPKNYKVFVFIYFQSKHLEFYDGFKNIKIFFFYLFI